MLTYLQTLNYNVTPQKDLLAIRISPSKLIMEFRGTVDLDQLLKNNPHDIPKLGKLAFAQTLPPNSHPYRLEGLSTTTPLKSVETMCAGLGTVARVDLPTHADGIAKGHFLVSFYKINPKFLLHDLLFQVDGMKFQPIRHSYLQPCTRYKFTGHPALICPIPEQDEEISFKNPTIEDNIMDNLNMTNLHRKLQPPTNRTRNKRDSATTRTEQVFLKFFFFLLVYESI